MPPRSTRISGAGQAQPQDRDQRLPAGEHLAVLAGALEGPHGLVHRGRGARSRTDAGITAALPCSRRTLHLIARQIRSGVQGIWMSLTPNGRTASRMALTTAGVAAIVPVSPTPFTPSGFVVDGLTVRSVDERRHVRRRRQEIVDERAGCQVAVGVVHRLFEQGLRDALHHSAVHLAFDDERVDHLARHRRRTRTCESSPARSRCRPRPRTGACRAGTTAPPDRTSRRRPGWARRRRACRAPRTPRRRGPGWSCRCQGRPCTLNVPLANSTSSSLASSMCAAIRLALSITRRAAFDTAIAPTATDREP